MAIFNQEAENYDKWYETRIGKHADSVETECAFHLFPIDSQMKVLDVGCGTGNFSIKLAKRGALVTGIDISENMLAVARERIRQEKVQVEFKQMDCQDLQFPDHFFDGVLSMATIEFISEPRKMIGEMFRVCKKGGLILVGTINRESAWGQMYQDPVFQEKVPVFRHAHFRTPEDLMVIKKDVFIAVRECLFVPPDIPEAEINPEKENELSSFNSGGFFCVLWKKQD